MSASDAIGFERLEALLAGDAPRTTDEARRAAVLARAARATLQRARGAALRACSRRALAPARRSRSGRRGGSCFAVIPAALALAVTAAIVHGLTTRSGATAGERARRQRPRRCAEPSAKRAAPRDLRRRRRRRRATAHARLRAVDARADRRYEPPPAHRRVAAGARARHRASLERDARGDANRDVARRLCAVGRLPDAAGRQRHREHRAARSGAERAARARAARRRSARSSRRTCR